METPTSPNHPNQPLLCLSWGRVPSTDTPRLCGASSPRPLLWLAKKNHNKPPLRGCPRILDLGLLSGSGLWPVRSPASPAQVLAPKTNKSGTLQWPACSLHPPGRSTLCTARLVAAPVLTAPSVELNPPWKNPSGLFFLCLFVVFFPFFLFFCFFFPWEHCLTFSVCVYITAF